MIEVVDVGRDEMRRRQDWIGFAVMIPLGLLIAGCSGDMFGRSGAAPTGAPSSSPSLGDRFSNLFRSQPTQAPGQEYVAPTAPPQDYDCPGVSIRQGASAFSVSLPGADPTAMSLRYQANFGQISRDCQLTGTTLKIRVGIEGRVILGPAGGPGQLEIPLRIAVVQEGPEPKTIVTKLRWISVAIPPDQPSVPFSEIEDELTFPMPLQAAELDAYVVYVGFDRAAVKEPVKKPTVKKPPPKSSTKPRGSG